MDGADKSRDGGGPEKGPVMEVIAWDKLSDYIGKQLPAVIPIAGKKRLSIAVGKSARTLSLRIPYDGEDAGLASPYRELTYEITAVEGRRVLELATAAPELFPFLFVCRACGRAHGGTRRGGPERRSSGAADFRTAPSQTHSYE